MFIGQLSFKVSFDWTFNLNEDFAKGKHMAYQTTSAAALLVLGTQ